MYLLFVQKKKKFYEFPLFTYKLYIKLEIANYYIQTKYRSLFLINKDKVQTNQNQDDPTRGHRCLTRFDSLISGCRVCLRPSRRENNKI